MSITECDDLCLSQCVTTYVHNRVWRPMSVTLCGDLCLSQCVTTYVCHSVWRPMRALSVMIYVCHSVWGPMCVTVCDDLCLSQCGDLCVSQSVTTYICQCGETECDDLCLWDSHNVRETFVDPSCYWFISCPYFMSNTPSRISIISIINSLSIPLMSVLKCQPQFPDLTLWENICRPFYDEWCGLCLTGTCVAFKYTHERTNQVKGVDMEIDDI